MATNKGLRVRDPIHGLIPYDRTEEAVINSWPLQRLRGIKQLALASLGYPGALHTRFDHTLGVMHLAGRMMDTLRPHLMEAGVVVDEDQFELRRRQVRLAALVHDVGHGPFSHVSEHVLDHVSGGAAHRAGVSQAKLHEQVTLAILDNDRELREILSEEERGAVRTILDTASRTERSVFADIVSGSLDADKLDYLLRDAHFAGVRYGVFDLDRILDAVRVLDAKPGSQLAIDDDGVPPVEQLYVARYHMTLQVYRHKIRRITDALLRRASTYAVEDGVEGLRALYTFPVAGERTELQNFVEHYLLWNDDRVMEAVSGARSRSPRAAKLVDALRRRSLPKEVFHTDVDDIGLDAVVADRIEEEIPELEEWVADRLNVDRDFVVADLQDIEAKTGALPGRAINPEELLVVVDGRAQKLTARSKVFERGALEPKSYLSVFVPEPSGADPGWRQSAGDAILAHLREQQ